MNVQQGADAVGGIAGGAIHGLLEWLQPKSSIIDNFGDFVFFQYVIHRLQHDIQVFGERVLGRVMAVVAVVALTVLTIWILFQGYRLLTGQLRESAMGLVVNAAKAAFIVGMALSFGVANDPMTNFLTFDLKNGIHEIITGNVGSPEDEIDSNLGWMQVAMSSMDLLDSGGSLDTNSEKERAQTWIGFGTAGPAITAGALMLMYQVAIALFIGLGPIFILCLLFDSTKSLFQKWLFYGIGTMFSMAVLSAMVTIALRMVTDVAEGMWASDALITLVPGLGGGGVVSYSSRAMQTGSMGMILTLLLITVPPMVASFFNGTMGQFTWASAWGMGGAQRTGPGGQAPGTPGYFPTSGERTPGPERDRPRDMSDTRNQNVRNYDMPTLPTRGNATSAVYEQQDVIPHGSGLRQQTGSPQHASRPDDSSSAHPLQPKYTSPRPDEDLTPGSGRRGS